MYYGRNSYTGTLKIGHNVKIGYFAQNQASLLDESITVFDTIDRVAVGDIQYKNTGYTRCFHVWGRGFRTRK